MASLDDYSVLEKGTSLRIGSWIFVANGSCSFESYSTDQDFPEAVVAANRHEFDEFINLLEEIGFSGLNNEDRIQPKFDAIKAPSKKIPPTERPHFPIASMLLNQVFERKSQRLASKELLAKISSRKTLFQASMILMKKSSAASRKLKTLSTSTLLSKNSPTSGLLTLQSWNKIKLSSNISRNWTNQSPKMN